MRYNNSVTYPIVQTAVAHTYHDLHLASVRSVYSAIESSHSIGHHLILHEEVNVVPVVLICVLKDQGGMGAVTINAASH